MGTAGSGAVEWLVLLAAVCWAVPHLVRAVREARHAEASDVPAAPSPRRRRAVVVDARDDARCVRGHHASLEVLRTRVRGTGPVTVVVCARCDRLRCERCRQPLAASATRCSCGAWVTAPG
ncbi:hypothetical protein LFM56_01610 [Cellulomonas iranensis]|uniref:hypothetical protein n=1 Tax=Cellulomonas iranensis TaxID=76862 RepID=UPI001CF31D20|nr:hypothetical protein [Cellulomonas iranensis]UCN15052.1 hypothetical protein LFM56_01610 [Cellulomonas iranensis]